MPPTVANVPYRVASFCVALKKKKKKKKKKKINGFNYEENHKFSPDDEV